MPETNYTHEHFPGNFMDVLKNVVYISVVKAFQAEHPEGVTLVETHSGPVRAVVLHESACKVVVILLHTYIY
jgi:23S rRNA A2030 N6-methylase RlmJ